MTQRYFIISILTLAVLGLSSYITWLSLRPQSSISIRRTLQADAIMENISAVIMDKQGKPSMKIVSPRMIHYAADDTSHLLEPELTLYRKSPKPWFIRAKYAKASQGIEQVHFWDNVTIHHAADESNPATMIKTPTLTVHPNKQIALTRDLITLIQPNLVVKAEGMHADMNTGDIKLISNARGEYVPNS